MSNRLNFLILPPIPLWVYLQLVLHGWDATKGCRILSYRKEI